MSAKRPYVIQANTPQSLRLIMEAAYEAEATIDGHKVEVEDFHLDNLPAPCRYGLRIDGEESPNNYADIGAIEMLLAAQYQYVRRSDVWTPVGPQ